MPTQTWIPLLFLVIGVYHAVTAWQEYQRMGKKMHTPLFKAKSRVAGIFIVLALFLFAYLAL